MSSFSAIDLRQLESMFHLVDSDRSGSISRHEFARLLHSLHLRFTQQEVDSLIAACDANDDGEIDWNEFVHVMQQQTGGAATGGERDELIEAFKEFEGVGGREGVLDVGMLEKAVELLMSGGDRQSEERRRAVDDMIQHLRVDVGGGFHYRQFLHNPAER